MAKKIAPRRSAGLDRARGAFWRGDRADQVLDARRVRYAAEVEAKQVQRAKNRRRSPRGAGSVSSLPHPSLPSTSLPQLKLLRRLRRNVRTRKTLAARQRAGQRLAALEKEIARAAR